VPRPSPRDESKEKDVALQFSLVCAGTYADPAFFAETPAWPVPRAAYDPAVGRLSTEVCFDEAELAEELGFDMVSVSEHHYWPLIPTPNAALTAAALTQRTKRVRLGWLGPLVSMSNPVRIAEEAAQLDEMSGGRLSLLFLRGTPNEFLAYNVNPDETRARTQEATQLIVRALSEPQPFGWEGRYYRFPTVSVWPGATQLPHPPIFASGNSPESVAFAARHRFALALSFYPPHLVAKLVQTYYEAAAAAGWTPTPEQILYRGFVYCGRSDAAAEEVAARYFGAGSMSAQIKGRASVVAEIGHSRVASVEALAANQPAPKGSARKAAGFALGSLAFYGGPESMVEQITKFYEETGVGFLDLVFTGGGLTREERRDSITRFGQQVIPQLRGLGANVQVTQNAS
jgi:alkanesulfonate monooxygenase SsuD/methylene tetrahydromethanopterin reductase-like flavin-dependent oxidoreductase (luciferase family)